MNPLLGRAFNDELEKLSRATAVSLPSSRLSSTEEGGVFGSGTRTKKEDLGSIGTKQEGKLPVFDDIKPKKAPKPAKAPRPRQPGPSPKVKIEHPGTAKLKARIEGERKHHAALGNLSSKSLATYRRVKDPRLQAQAKAIQAAGGNPQSLLTAGQNPIFPRPIGAPAPKPVVAPPRPTYTGGKVTMNSPATRAAASRMTARWKLKIKQQKQRAHAQNLAKQVTAPLTSMQGSPLPTSTTTTLPTSTGASPPKWTLTDAQRADLGLSARAGSNLPALNWRQRIMQGRKGA